MPIPFELKRTFSISKANGNCRYSFVIKDMNITPSIKEFMDIYSYGKSYDFDGYNTYYTEFFVLEDDLQTLSNYLITSEGK
jgi:hypothetical protein